MKVLGLLDVARAAFAALIRACSGGVAWVASAIGLGADLVDPTMPESVWRPREWLPRLWARSRPRTAETKD